MSNKSKSKLNMFHGLVFLTVTSIFAATLSTYSWFTANQKADNSMGNITAVAGNITGTDMKCYSIDEINGNSYRFINNENYVLPRFDPSNIDYSEYEKALMFRVTFNCASAASYTIRAYTIEDFHTDTEIAIQNEDHLSNCASFKVGQSTEPVDISSFTSAIVNVTSEVSFASVQGESPNRSVNKNKTIEIASINAIPGENVVYVVMEYNNPVISYINDIRQNNPSPIRYLNDISFRIEEANA